MSEPIRYNGGTMAIEIIRPKEPRGEIWVWAQDALLLAYFLVPRLSSPWYPPRVLQGLGVLFLGWGLLLFVGGLRTLGRHNLTSCPKPMKTGILATGGAFRYCRHPAYLGVILMALGWPLTQGHVSRLLVALGLAVFLDAKARREEKYLAEKYPEYPAYAAKTKRLIPGIY